MHAPIDHPIPPEPFQLPNRGQHQPERPIPTTVTELLHEIKKIDCPEQAKELYQSLFELLPLFSTQDFKDFVGIVFKPANIEQEFIEHFSLFIKPLSSLTHSQQQIRQESEKWIVGHDLTLSGPKQVLKQYIQTNIMASNESKIDLNHLSSFLSIRFADTYLTQLIENAKFYRKLHSTKKTDATFCQNHLNSVLSKLPQFIAQELESLETISFEANIVNERSTLSHQILNSWHKQEENTRIVFTLLEHSRKFADK